MINGLYKAEVTHRRGRWCQWLWAADARVVPVLRARDAAWYHKAEPTFSDAIAAVRRVFWAAPNLPTSRDSPDHVEIPAHLWRRCAETLAFAA